MIKWSRLVLLPIVDYLCSNGMLLFRQQFVSLDQFYIYYDLNAIKQHDWVADCAKNELLELNCSAQNLVKEAKKRLPIHKSNKNNNALAIISSSKKAKRRMNDDATSPPTASFNNSQLNNNLHTKSPINKRQQHFSRYQPIEANRIESQFEINKMQRKMHELSNLLADEKENTSKFGHKLVKTVNNETAATCDLDQEVTSSNQITSSSTDLNTIDSLLKKLSEEKQKTKQFSDKLNEFFDPF